MGFSRANPEEKEFYKFLFWQEKYIELVTGHGKMYTSYYPLAFNRPLKKEPVSTEAETGSKVYI